MPCLALPRLVLSRLVSCVVTCLVEGRFLIEDFALVFVRPLLPFHIGLGGWGCMWTANCIGFRRKKIAH